MTMNAHQLTDLIFDAAETQRHSGRTPPYLCIISARECSAEELHKARDNLMSKGYVLTISQKESQYNLLAVPQEVFERNEMAPR
jgi:hypothetical protein